MTPFELATLEASRRVEVMPSEFKVWQKAASGNVDGMGIHEVTLTAKSDPERVVWPGSDLVAVTS
jgi:hypothetical protein